MSDCFDAHAPLVSDFQRGLERPIRTAVKCVAGGATRIRLSISCVEQTLDLSPFSFSFNASIARRSYHSDSDSNRAALNGHGLRHHVRVHFTFVIRIDFLRSSVASSACSSPWRLPRSSAHCCGSLTAAKPRKREVSRCSRERDLHRTIARQISRAYCFDYLALLDSRRICMNPDYRECFRSRRQRFSQPAATARAPARRLVGADCQTAITAPFTDSHDAQHAGVYAVEVLDHAAFLCGDLRDASITDSRSSLLIGSHVIE